MFESCSQSGSWLSNYGFLRRLEEEEYQYVDLMLLFIAFMSSQIDNILKDAVSDGD